MDDSQRAVQAEFGSPKLAAPRTGFVAPVPTVEQAAPGASAGPYVTAPHSQRHVICRPHEQAMLPTSIRPGCNRWPRGHRSGGLTIHCPVVDRTSSPTAGIHQR